MKKAEIAQRIVTFMVNHEKNKVSPHSHTKNINVTSHPYADIVSGVFVEEKTVKNKGRVGYKIKEFFLMKKLNKILKILCNLGILMYDANVKTYSLSKIALTILEIDDVEIDEKTIEDIYNFTEQINDRQYRSYNWNDSKIQNLLTIGSAVSAGILFALQFLSNLKLT